MHIVQDGKYSISIFCQNTLSIEYYRDKGNHYRFALRLGSVFFLHDNKLCTVKYYFVFLTNKNTLLNPNKTVEGLPYNNNMSLSFQHHMY
jgi:hypothetical protein